MSSALKVFSGKCCLCDVGIPANAKSTWGVHVEVHTGDIIMLWHGNYLGTDLEEWIPSSELTCVVAEQYQSYSNGDISINDPAPTPFPMGIKACGFDHPEWRVQVVKKYTDVVDGEHWKAYGFSFSASETADAAKARGEA